MCLIHGIAVIRVIVLIVGQLAAAASGHVVIVLVVVAAAGAAEPVPRHGSVHGALAVRAA